MNKNKKRLMILLILAAVIVAGTGAYYFSNKHNGAENTTSTEGVDLSPATKADKARAEANKDRIAEEQKNNQSDSSNTSGSLKTVSPTITYAGQYDGQVQVGAYVSGVLETTGSCTATLSKDGKSVTKQVTATQNASSMGCPEMAFQPSDVTPGNWTVTVTYTSSSAKGASESKTLTVQ